MPAVCLCMLFKVFAWSHGHRHFNAFHTHGSQKLKTQCKAKRAIVDLVDELLHVHRLVRRFEQTSQLFVRELLAVAHVFDDGFGLRLVKRVRFHRGWSYMVLGLCAL